MTLTTFPLHYVRLCSMWMDPHHCPPTKLREGNVFTCVCLFTDGGGPYDHYPWCIGPHRNASAPTWSWPWLCPSSQTLDIESPQPFWVGKWAARIHLECSLVHTTSATTKGWWRRGKTSASHRYGLGSSPGCCLGSTLSACGMSFTLHSQCLVVFPLGFSSTLRRARNCSNWNRLIITLPLRCGT